MEMLIGHPLARREKWKKPQPKASRPEARGRSAPVVFAPESAASPVPSPDVLVKARACLTRASSRFIRSLTCELVGETLEITGTVPTYYQKQIAQELIRGALPTARIKNCVRVP